MKRLIAMLLVSALTVTLCLAADPDGAAIPPSTQNSAQETPPTDAEEAAEAPAVEEAVQSAAAPAPETTTAAVPAAAAPQTQSTTIGFDGIDSRVRSQNITVQANAQTLKGIDAMDTDLQEINAGYGQSSMENLSDSLADALMDLQNAATDDPDLLAAVGRGLTATKALVDMNAATYKAQLKAIKDDDSIHDNYILSKKQFEYVADQLVMAAQTLFITVHSLQIQQQDLQLTLSQLTRTQGEMEKRYALGQISELDLLQVKNQRSQVASGIETLKVQVQNLKGDLAILLGMDPSSNLTLSALPVAKTTTANYDTDLKTVIKESYDLYFKNDTIRTASNSYEDSETNTLYAYEAAKMNYASAEKQLTQNFRKITNAVPEKKRLYGQAQDNTALQQRLFDAATTKYNRGLLSKNEYSTEKETLETKQHETAKAEIELFTAVNQYNWALRGVVATS